jgi:hypothetical protein
MTGGTIIVRKLQLLKHDWLYFDRSPTAECQRCKMLAWSIDLPQGPCAPKTPVEAHHPYITEQLDILRRIAERGKSLCEGNLYVSSEEDVQKMFVDIFVHLLDEIERTENAYLDAS